ncbi:MAG: HAD-IA family hydrolase [Candidatus Micrarchaeia archaeon]
MVKLIIFDIGGVMLDFSEDEYASYISHKLGISERLFKKELMRLIEKMELGYMGADDLENALSKKFHVPKGSFEFGKAFAKLAKLNWNVINLVKKLSKHYKVVLLTNVSFVRYMEMRRLWLSKAHLRTFASCYLHMRKPSVRIYKYVLKELGVEAKDALFIDNMEENVNGAKRAGIKSFRFVSYEDLVKRLIDLGIEVV